VIISGGRDPNFTYGEIQAIVAAFLLIVCFLGKNYILINSNKTKFQLNSQSQLDASFFIKGIARGTLGIYCWCKTRAEKVISKRKLLLMMRTKVLGQNLKLVHLILVHLKGTNVKAKVLVSLAPALQVNFIYFCVRL